MARTLVLAALAVAALAIVGQAAAHPRALGGGARLTLTDRNPVKVHGSGFHAGERVRVSATMGPGPRITRHVTASSAGSFALSMHSNHRPCGRLRISATGSQGSFALLRRALPNCIVD